MGRFHDDDDFYDYIEADGEQWCDDSRSVLYRSWTRRNPKGRKQIWQSKGKSIAKIMELFFTLGANTLELNKKVKDISFLKVALDDSSIAFLEKSFRFLENHFTYLEENKNKEAVKEFRDWLEDLLYKVSKTTDFVDAIHIPPLPTTTYSFKDFVSFLTMVKEKPVDEKFSKRRPERACMSHVNYFYRQYMKKAEPEEREYYLEDEEKPSPTQFSSEELAVLQNLAVEVKHFFIDADLEYFPSCLPDDIRDFVAALSLQCEFSGDDKDIERIHKAIEILDEDFSKFRNAFRNFVKHMIPIPYIEGKKKDSKSERDD